MSATRHRELLDEACRLLEASAIVPTIASALEEVTKELEIRTDTFAAEQLSVDRLLDVARRVTSRTVDHASAKVRRLAFEFVRRANEMFERVESTSVNSTDARDVDWALGLCERRARIEKDETTREAVCTALCTISKRVRTITELKTALMALEPFARDEEAGNAIAALETCWAMLTRDVARHLVRNEDVLRRCEEMFWTIRSTCARHRRGIVRSAAVRACGGLATALVIGGHQSLVPEAYANDMLRSSLDVKPDVVRAVCESISESFIARIEDGTYTVREEDGASLCALLVGASIDDDLLSFLKVVNDAHATKMMGEGCRTVVCYSLKDVFVCLTRNPTFREDKRAFEISLRAIALAIEHVGALCAEFTRDIVDAMASGPTNAKVVDIHRVVESLLTYAPESRYTWIEPTMTGVESTSRGESYLEIAEAFVSAELDRPDRSMDPSSAAHIADALLKCGDLTLSASCAEIVAALLELTRNRFDDVSRRCRARLKAIEILNDESSRNLDEDSADEASYFIDNTETDQSLTHVESHFEESINAYGDASEWRRYERALIRFYVRVRGDCLSERILRAFEERIDPANFDGSVHACLAVKCHVRAFAAYIGVDGRFRRGENSLQSSLLAPVLDNLLSWLRWRPGAAVAEIRGMVVSCLSRVASTSRDAKDGDILIQWLSHASRVSDAMKMFCTLSLHSDEIARAMGVLRRAVYAADPDNARAHLDQFARKYMDDLSTSTFEHERERACEALRETLEHMGTSTEAAAHLRELFPFADDANEVIRRTVRATLERAKTHHSTLVEDFASSPTAKSFVHTDGLAGLRAVSAEDGW